MPEQSVGGGGTRFTPVVDWVANQGNAPVALIYFTDAMGEFPEREPGYSVLWLVKGRGKVPWGMRVQLNSRAIHTSMLNFPICHSRESGNDK